MGTMSASDAAPLPRLGEVFFDVRGDSRTMRLSWYADTGVAVLSIWQGEMCTGTFRLAIADLPRMAETLQRGPARRAPGYDAGHGRGYGPEGQAGFGPADAATRAGFAPADGPNGHGGFGPADGPNGHGRFGPADTASRAGFSQTDATAQVPAMQPASASGWFGPETGGYHSGPADHADYPDERARAQYQAEPADYGTRPAPYPGGPPDPRHEPAHYAGPGYPGSERGYPPPEPGYAPGPGYPEPGYQDAEPGYAPEPGYPAREAAYPSAETGYPGQAGHQTQPGYAAEGGYPGEPGYDGYPADPGYPPGPGYSADHGYPAEPGYYAPGAPDYRDGVQAAHYPGSAREALATDALDQSTADYPTHYGMPAADDGAEEVPPESFGYGQAPGNQAAAYRHARHGARFD
jgi:hypothetical protein